MFLGRRNHKRTLKVLLYFIFSIFIYTILLHKISSRKEDANPTFTTFYWEQRTSNESNPVLDKILRSSSLWRPTDEFTGNWNNSYDDRMLQQILWASNVRPTHKKRIALPDGYAWWWHTKDSLARQLQKDCPNLANHCEYVETSKSPKKRDLAGVDAIIFNFDSSYTKLPKGNFTKAVYILESSYHVSAQLTGTDLLLSYWRGSDMVTPYGKWVYYEESMKGKEQGRNYAEGKSKMAAMFVSNCGANNGRLAYVKELQKHGLAVDIYGSCGTLTCSRQDADSCFKKLRNDYKFYFAFENSNCRDYITEKFFGNALGNDVVPVVMGGHYDDYLSNAPLNSFIHIDSFASAEGLVQYLNFLDKNDAEYNKYFSWRGTGEFINTKFFCTFCGMMHYADVVPVPQRSQSLEFSESANTWRPQNSRPCLPQNQFHWNSPENN